MSVKTTISISDARKNIFDIAEQVQKPGTVYTLTEKGRPKAVIMSAEEFESWAETLEVMREFPNLDNDIQEAEKNYRSGDYITLNELLTKQGFIVSDKSQKNMGYTVVVPKKVQKELERVDKRYLARISLSLKLIEQDPFAGKKLEGQRAGEYSYRVWPFRILYRIYKHELVILVIKIAHRQGVY